MTTPNTVDALMALDLNQFAEICHNAHIDFALDKFPSYERAIEHHYLEHLNRVAAAASARALAAMPEQQAGGVPAGWRDELIRIARMAEDLKRPCGEDPESPIAIHNGRIMNVSYALRSLAAAPSPSASAAQAADG